MRKFRAAPVGMKYCPSCKSNQLLADFYTDKRTGDGLKSCCKPCSYRYHRAFLRKNPEYAAMKMWKAALARHGLTPERYAALLREQGGGCAICQRALSKGQRTRLAVDHDHQTGRVRGILCSSCNGGLGLFRDNVELLERAIEYLCRQGMSDAVA